jgi:hypothetical protein
MVNVIACPAVEDIALKNDEAESGWPVCKLSTTLQRQHHNEKRTAAQTLKKR